MALRHEIDGPGETALKRYLGTIVILTIQLCSILAQSEQLPPFFQDLTEASSSPPATQGPHMGGNAIFNQYAINRREEKLSQLQTWGNILDITPEARHFILWVYQAGFDASEEARKIQNEIRSNPNARMDKAMEIAVFQSEAMPKYASDLDDRPSKQIVAYLKTKGQAQEDYFKKATEALLMWDGTQPSSAYEVILENLKFDSNLAISLSKQNKFNRAGISHENYF